MLLLKAETFALAERQTMAILVAAGVENPPISDPDDVADALNRILADEDEPVDSDEQILRQALGLRHGR